MIKCDPLCGNSTISKVSGGICKTTKVNFPVYGLSENKRTRYPMIAALIDRFNRKFLAIHMLPYLILTIEYIARREILIDSHLVLYILIGCLAVEAGMGAVIPYVDSGG